MLSPPQAFFIDADTTSPGQRFALLHSPAAGVAVRGVVVYVHPFAEEMNKARRMAALQSRSLAGAGFAVLQVDLLGCGDSAGDFADATWEAWVDDVVMACNWICHRFAGPVWLWGLRAGCLLAAQASHRLTQPHHLLFWQAPASGQVLLQQFLRLKAAADLLGGQGKALMEAMRLAIAAGQSIEVAGYTVSAALANGLAQAALSAPQPRSGSQRVEWLEVSTRPEATLSPVAAKTIEQFQLAGWQVGQHVVRGPAFWQTVEIEDAPDLVLATTEALCR